MRVMLQAKDAQAIAGLLQYIRAKGFEPPHPLDPPPTGPYDKKARTISNIDEALSNLLAAEPVTVDLLRELERVGEAVAGPRVRGWSYDRHTDPECAHDWIPVSGAQETCVRCSGVRHPVDAPD